MAVDEEEKMWTAPSEKEENQHNGSLHNSRIRYLKMFLWISLSLNVLILTAMCSFVIERFADNISQQKGCNKQISSIPSIEQTKSTHPPAMGMSKDYFQCKQCELMSLAAEIKYENTNGSTICCKRMDRNKYQEVNRGSILSQCTAMHDPHKERPALLLLYSKGCSACKELKKGFAWENPNSITNTTSYKKGNVDVNFCSGEITIKEDGLYGIYSYIQFDSYTVNNQKRMDKDFKVYQMILNTRTNQMLQFSRFTLEKDAYTKDQIGPVIIPLKASDKLVVKTNYEIYVQPDYTVFGLYKLG